VKNWSWSQQSSTPSIIFLISKNVWKFYIGTVYCVLCTVYCVLCTVYCVLCTWYLVRDAVTVTRASSVSVCWSLPSETGIQWQVLTYSSTLTKWKTRRTLSTSRVDGWPLNRFCKKPCLPPASFNATEWIPHTVLVFRNEETRSYPLLMFNVPMIVAFYHDVWMLQEFFELNPDAYNIRRCTPEYMQTPLQWVNFSVKSRTVSSFVSPFQ
jgi:hypothetical protein